ncbi:MAG: serine hydrolase domain-containing protein [Saprospiraceae bacterium]
MKKIKIITLISIALFINSCITHKATFDGKALESVNISSTDFDGNQLKELTKYIADSSNTTALVVLQNGKLLYQYGDITAVSYLASCRKSVLSMLYGKYVDDGTIDLNTTIGELGIDEKDGLLPIEKQATIDHIINSRSGVFHEAANGGYDKSNFKERGSVKPGEYYVYNNWDFNVAGYIFEKYAEKSIYEEIEEQLAIPLGFEDWNIKNQRKYHRKKKSQYPAYHMYFSTRDMAKIGQLMLNEGKWNGKQLISKSWIEKSTTTVTPHKTLVERYGEPQSFTPKFSYAYMWWLVDDYNDNLMFEGAYMASGYGGQFIFVIPKYNMVIAHKTTLNLRTKLGLSYKATYDYMFYEIVNRLVNAKK